MTTAEQLLLKVLKTCRAKSSISLQQWKTLESEIVGHLDGKPIDIEFLSISPLKLSRERCTQCKAHGYKMKQANNLIKKYKKREAAIHRVIMSDIVKREEW